jgi:hypothetical protein
MEYGEVCSWTLEAEWKSFMISSGVIQLLSSPRHACSHRQERWRHEAAGALYDKTTVADRVAQTVVKLIVEPVVEPVFHESSYGYRPNRSAQQALALARKRCWRRDWVIDLDIKGFFDNLDHKLIMRAVEHHIREPWVLLCIKRWLQAPVENKKLRGRKKRAARCLGRVAQKAPWLMAHWRAGCVSPVG